MHALRSGRAVAVVGAASALVLAVALAAPAAAQTATTTVAPVLALTTPYPAVLVEPGSTVKLDLSATAQESVRMDNSIDGLPDGWKDALRGGGFVIAGVTAGPTAGTAQLEVDVPSTAQAGDYPITVRGKTPSGESDLDITVSVATQVDSGINLTADFPSLTGGPTDTFTYTLTIENDTPAEVTFNFAGTGPEGWTVAVSPTAQAKANTVTIAGGDKSTVSVTATPPADVASGQYPIAVQVTSQNGPSGSIKLMANVTGAAALDAATADGRLNLSGHANHESKESITVTNSGTAPLPRVSLTATPPSGWQVTFDPPSIDSIDAGQSAQVVADIKPAKDALSGDYDVSVAVNGASKSKTLDLRYTVKTSRSWGLLGIALIIVAVVVLGGVIRKVGRR
jgi:uncharacterized membrane protein